jgi:hypothetical protein
MRLVTGMTLGCRRMFNRRCGHRGIMAAAAKFINIITKQILLPGMRLVGIMTGQAVTVEQGLMQRGCAFLPQPLGADFETVELMAVQAERTGLLNRHAPVVTGMGRVAVETLALAHRRVRLGVGQSFIFDVVTLLTELIGLLFQSKGLGRSRFKMTLAASQFGRGLMQNRPQKPRFIG